jgi:glucose/arabinose dehydrogenase
MKLAPRPFVRPAVLSPHGILAAFALLSGFACGGVASVGDEPAAETRSAATVGLALQPMFGETRFAAPLGMVQAPGSAGRFYVLEKGGVVKVTDAAGNATVFADLRSRINAAGEGGLLGMAFHPAFADNRAVFFSFTSPSPTSPANMRSVIARGKATADGLTLDPASLTVVLAFDQPFSNHNGGNIAFGPDGMLYAGYGDGGSGGDPQQNGQKKTTLLGKMLRLDVDRGTPYAIPDTNPFADGNEGRPEIFALGLRNPWRWSFDRTTGDLWVGDVGQGAWEEVDKVVLGGNYGWGLREGKHCFGASPCATLGTDPVIEYGRSDGKSITGGFVYRGQAIPSLAGEYLYGDFLSGKVWSVPSETAATETPRHVLTVRSLSSFAEDLAGELYVINLSSGQVSKIVAAP